MVITLIDSIMVINKSSLPLFSYDKKATKDEFITDDEILVSSFFSAIINFASQLKADELKYIVFDKRSFVIKKTSDFTIIFSTYSKVNDSEINQLENTLDSTSSYLLKLLRDEGLLVDNPILKESVLKTMVDKFAKYLLDNGIIIDNNFDFDPLYVQRKYRKMIFKSIGYEPGKCNIGPQERQKRFIMGLYGFILSLITYLGITALSLPHEYILLLFFPLTMSFIGFYQYFFKFCVRNGLSKRAVMR